jgi:hypothetical protein
LLHGRSLREGWPEACRQLVCFPFPLSPARDVAVWAGAATVSLTASAGPGRALWLAVRSRLFFKPQTESVSAGLAWWSWRCSPERWHRFDRQRQSRSWRLQRVRVPAKRTLFFFNLAPDRPLSCECANEAPETRLPKSPQRRACLSKAGAAS